MTKIVFMGTPLFAVPVLKMLIANYDVCLVVTKPDCYVGRKKELSFSPVKKVAQEFNIPVFQPVKIKKDYQKIIDVNPDIIITCAYGMLIPDELINLPPLGCINVHASLLPKYRGASPIQSAIINGEEKTGISIMYMDKGMDTGDIIKKSSIPISSSDNCSTIHDKLSILGVNLLQEVLPTIINHTNKREKQDNNESSYAPIITREMEHLNFNDKASKINNLVRGLYPLANFLLDNVEIKVLSGYIGDNTKDKPSKIVDIKKDAIGISTQDRIYYLTKIKPAGKKVMDVKDYLNGIDKNKLLNKFIN